MNDAPIGADEAGAWLTPLTGFRHVVLAVSGGADSTALMLLAAAWMRGRTGMPPALTVVTVDHGLRAGSAAEATAVETAAARHGLPCRRMTWQPSGPARRLQERARQARYALLAEAAATLDADAVVTAHTLDDQAETLLMRLARGASVDGLAAMAGRSMVPGTSLTLLRPLLGVPHGRLVATLEAAAEPWIEDPSNCNQAFERIRLRMLLEKMAGHGIERSALALSAGRLQRARAALEHATDVAEAALLREKAACVHLEGAGFAALPAEIRLRLLARAIRRVTPAGDAGYPLRLDRLEALETRLATTSGAKRTSLGGALISRDRNGGLTVSAEAERRRGRAHHSR